MRVLGIDPGTAIVGYGIVDYRNNKYEKIDYGCISTCKSLDLDERLLIIFNELEELIKKYQPDYIAVEELFFFKNSKTVISVGQARGVIVLAGIKNGLKVSGYTPLQVKMGVTGYGKADKKQVQEMVKRILKLEKIPKPDDAADGLSIAVTHINTLISTREITEKNDNEKVDTSLKINDGIRSNSSVKMSAKDYRELILKKR